MDRARIKAGEGLQKKMTSIYRPDEETVSIEELLNLATVTAEDIDEAIAQWQENPPDKGFVELLEAEET